MANDLEYDEASSHHVSERSSRPMGRARSFEMVFRSAGGVFLALLLTGLAGFKVGGGNFRVWRGGGERHYEGV